MSFHNFKQLKPSNWVEKYLEIIPKGGTVLDLACGSGRHTRLLLNTGRSVTALDRDVSKLEDLSNNNHLKIFKFDLEGNVPWPFNAESFDGIIVVNYLYRPLFPMIIDALAVNGVLIYQTFAIGNEKYGRPNNPDYLLKNNELLNEFGEQLQVVKFDHGYIRRPSPAIMQSICCIKQNVKS